MMTQKTFPEHVIKPYLDRGHSVDESLDLASQEFVEEGEALLAEKKIAAKNEIAVSRHEDMRAFSCAVLANSLAALRNKNAAIYRVSERFGVHLRKTKIDIPSTLLKSQNEYCFFLEFPFSFPAPRRENGPLADGSVSSCIVQWLPGEKLPRLCTSAGESVLCMLFPSQTLYPSIQITMSSRLVLPDSMTISEAINESCKWRGLSVADQAAYSDMVDFAVKSALYIKSGDPDLQPEIAPKYPTTKKAKKLKAFARNHCLFDVINVGYSYHNRLYHVDGTQVSGHFRWQPYGPGMTKVKLIWIEEHERKYKNVRQQISAEAAV